MRVFLTFTALLVGFDAPSQTTFWNPDADGSGYVSASDLLPFLGVFGLDFEATPLYCQDTSSVVVNFPFGPDQPSNQLVEYAPLAPIIYVTADGDDQFRYADLYLPTDSVPNGYRLLVVNVSNLVYGVDVLPTLMTGGSNDEVSRNKMREFLFFDGAWYPMEDEE